MAYRLPKDKPIFKGSGEMILLLFLISYLYCGKLDEVIRKLELTERTLKNIQFSYIQSTFSTITRQTHTISGEVTFEKPHFLFIKFFQPKEQILLADEKNIRIYTKELNQILKLKWKNLSTFFPTFPSFFPFSIKARNIKDRVVEFKSNDMYILTILLNKTTKLLLHVDKKEYIPLITELIFPEYISRMEIKTWKLNQKIDRKVLQESFPADAKVVNWE